MPRRERARETVMQDRDAIRKTLIEIMEADTGENFANVDETKNLAPI